MILLPPVPGNLYSCIVYFLLAFDGASHMGSLDWFLVPYLKLNLVLDGICLKIYFLRGFHHLVYIILGVSRKFFFILFSSIVFIFSAPSFLEIPLSSLWFTSSLRIYGPAPDYYWGKSSQGSPGIFNSLLVLLSMIFTGIWYSPLSPLWILNKQKNLIINDPVM